MGFNRWTQQAQLTFKTSWNCIEIWKIIALKIEGVPATNLKPFRGICHKKTLIVCKKIDLATTGTSSLRTSAHSKKRRCHTSAKSKIKTTEIKKCSPNLWLPSRQTRLCLIALVADGIWRLRINSKRLKTHIKATIRRKSLEGKIRWQVRRCSAFKDLSI